MTDENSQVVGRLGRGLRWILNSKRTSTAVGAGLGILPGAVIGVLTDNLVLWLIVGFLVFGVGGAGAGAKKSNGS